MPSYSQVYSQVCGQAYGQVYSQAEVNLHTHSWYCGHGKGDISDYVAAAKERGDLKVLGFSEHCPVPDNRWASTRMDYSLLPSYVDDVRKARDSEALLGDGGLRILLGAECDSLKSYFPYYRDELLGERGFDYLIGAVHFHHDEETGEDLYPNKIPNYTPFLGEYVENYTNMLESGLFLLGAHPDLFCYSTPWSPDLKAASKDIIQCALENDMPLEINGLGIRKGVLEVGGEKRTRYTIGEFWEMAVDAGVKICCNSDAHRPEDVHGWPLHDGYVNECFEFASKVGASFVSWKVEDKGIRPVVAV